MLMAPRRRNSAKAGAAAAVAAASSITDETANGQPKDCGDSSVVPPASPKRGKPKKHLPAVHGAISYLRWRSKYVREYRGGLYVAYNGKHHETPHNAVTVSEATGYGLLISVLQRERGDFDGFLRFWRRFLTPKGLMYWQLVRGGNGEIKANLGTLNSATDGDMDIAFALLLAAKAWGEPKYQEEGVKVCGALLAVCYNPDTQVLTLGDWCVPGHELRAVARPSDFMLTHLALFGAEDEDNETTWAACFDATLEAIEAQRAQHSTGLMADFVTYNKAAGRYEPVPGQILERPEDRHFYFNSCRTPWRLAVYYSETGDARVLPILEALTAFFEGQDVVTAGYTLEGRHLANFSHLSFTAPVCCLFKVMKSPHLARMTTAMHKLGENAYFGDTIQLLCELQTRHLPSC